MAAGRDRIFRTEGVVIKRSDFGEADRILTVYTPGLGKIRVIAKGVRRTTSRLGGHVELFTRSNMLIARGRNLDIVTQSQTVEAYRELRSDLSRIGHAYYVAELLDRMMHDEDENYPVYRLLVDTLSRLNSEASLPLVTRSFEVQLLRYSGYGPELRRCLSCNAELFPVVNLFSYSLGGTICRNCARSDASARDISVNALKMFRLLQDRGYEQAGRVRISQPLAWEMESIMRGYLAHVSQSKLKSVEFIHTIEREAQNLL